MLRQVVFQASQASWTPEELDKVRGLPDADEFNPNTAPSTKQRIRSVKTMAFISDVNFSNNITIALTIVIPQQKYSSKLRKPSSCKKPWGKTLR